MRPIAKPSPRASAKPDSPMSKRRSRSTCTQPRWPVAAHYDAVVCINMVHISPWSSTNALCLRRRAAPAHRRQTRAVWSLSRERHGRAVQSRLRRHAQAAQSEWGLRDLDEVTRVAALHGLQRQQVVRMPANNLTVVFSKTL